jgi:hypothetical protein
VSTENPSHRRSRIGAPARLRRHRRIGSLNDHRMLVAARLRARRKADKYGPVQVEAVIA